MRVLALCAMFKVMKSAYPSGFSPTIALIEPELPSGKCCLHPHVHYCQIVNILRRYEVRTWRGQYSEQHMVLATLYLR